MYKCLINTDSYKNLRCSKKNWEPGTVNDFMHALNRWHTTEKNLKHVWWRLNMFRGVNWLLDEYDDNNPDEYDGIESFGMSEEYTRWLNRPCNTVKYYDHLCGFERKHEPSGYGFMQGYFDIQQKLSELKKTGKTIVHFKELYDIRQYDKHMDGCYMIIWNSAKVIM